MNLKDAGIYDLTNLFKSEATTAHNGTPGGVITGVPRFINIPAYQRPYRWNANNICSLFADYNDSKSEYFLGSAVAVKPTNPTLPPAFDIVDGQQRITTLFLLNYIRYLLKREYILEKLNRPQMNAKSLCEGLKECYVNLIGKNSGPFNAILNEIDSLDDNETLSLDEKADKLLSLFKEELCIPTEKSTADETIKERKEKAEKFFNQDQLCLKYTRNKYNSTLKNALCNVFLVRDQNTNNLELHQIIEKDQFEEFAKNYLDALETIFDNLWNEAKLRSTPSSTWIELTNEAIKYADDIIKNMSFCIILTEDPKDANKLFEVLNDRSLEVEDLELIKNHFYQEYCTKSDDSDSIKDQRITHLDEIWTDRIFNDSGVTKRNLISYFAAVYLTGSTELVYKSESKLKDYIGREYSDQVYPTGTPYKYDDIEYDFNVYLAERIILDKFNFSSKNKQKTLLQAEQSNKSITYKAFHLLNEKDYTGVLVALLNVIISSYAKTNSLNDSNFETGFSTYIDDLINDVSLAEERFQTIHKCAYMLWIAAIKSEKADTPRAIAKRIISEYTRTKYSTSQMGFFDAETSTLDNELEKWLSNWTYGGNHTDMIKLLQLILLRSQRTINQNNTATVSINAALTYSLDAGDLQLDHLEAAKINDLQPNLYFLSKDREKRQQIVNRYIGNFMILDAKDNNSKNNVPLCKALKYYSKIDTSWMIQDLKNMIADPIYYDASKNIPKEEFFTYRTAQLKRYFKALLNIPYKGQSFTVSLQ